MGLPDKSAFYDFTPARTISGRGAFYLGSLSGSPFPVSPCGKTAGSPRPHRYGAGPAGRTSRSPLHGRNNFSAGRNLLRSLRAAPAGAWPRHTGHLVLYAQRYLPFARFISFPFSRLRRRGEIRSVKTMPSMWSYSCWMTQAFSRGTLRRARRNPRPYNASGSPASGARRHGCRGTRGIPRCRSSFPPTRHRSRG